MRWACCQYWPIHCEWANLPLTRPAMRVIARIKIGRYTHEYTKHSAGARADLRRRLGEITDRPGMWAAHTETRLTDWLTGSSDMKRLIHCQRPRWRVTLSHLEPLWIYQSNLSDCAISCERRVKKNQAAWLWGAVTGVCTCIQINAWLLSLQTRTAASW